MSTEQTCGLQGLRSRSCVQVQAVRRCLHLLLGPIAPRTPEVLTHLWRRLLVGPRSRWLLRLGRLLNSTHGLLGLLLHCLLHLLGRGGRPCPQTLKDGLCILSHACNSAKKIDQRSCQCKAAGGGWLVLTVTARSGVRTVADGETQSRSDASWRLLGHWRRLMICCQAKMRVRSRLKLAAWYKKPSAQWPWTLPNRDCHAVTPPEHQTHQPGSSLALHALGHVFSCHGSLFGSLLHGPRSRLALPHGRICCRLGSPFQIPLPGTSQRLAAAGHQLVYQVHHCTIRD